MDHESGGPCPAGEAEKTHAAAKRSEFWGIFMVKRNSDKDILFGKKVTDWHGKGLRNAGLSSLSKKLPWGGTERLLLAVT